MKLSEFKKDKIKPDVAEVQIVETKTHSNNSESSLHVPHFDESDKKHQRFLAYLKETNPDLYEKMLNWY